MSNITEINPFEREHAILSTLPMFQPKYTSFFQSSLEGRNVEYLKTSPLAQFKEKLCDFGAHFFGFGKGLVKGENLAFRAIVLGDKQLNELDFKINHVFRTALQQKLDEISSMDRHILNILLERAEIPGKNILVEHNVPFPLGNSSMGEATKISIEGLGAVFISTSPEFPSIYNRIVVQMEADKNISDFHGLLAFLNLHKSLQISSRDDQERHKVGHLFRTFYPRDAFVLERSETFFNLSIGEIKEKIIEKVPEMAIIFDAYLEQMTLEEILPGRMRYRITGLAKKAYDLGARGLTAALTGAWGKELYERTASILQSGLLSIETRKFLGLCANGLSTTSDFYSGGSDVVYTQMITEDNCRKNADLIGLNYSSDVRLIISLDALETGTYQYLDDAYGNRTTDPNQYWGTPYTQRPGILEFINTLQESTLFYGGRDRILQNRENPNFEEEWKIIEKGILRSFIEDRHFLEELRLVDYDERGLLRIMGMVLDEFLSFLKNWFFNLSGSDIHYSGHEVMIKERIPPKFIRRILVANDDVREELIHHLKDCNLIQNNQIQGRSVNEFILVESKASENLFV